MTRQKRNYSPEFKQEAIQLWRSSDKSATAIESELGITHGLLSRWKRVATPSSDLINLICTKEHKK